MLFRRTTGFSMLIFLVLATILSPTTFIAKEKKKEKPQGTPVLWQRPADIHSRNLRLGPGGAKPDLRRVTFVQEQKGGYSKKYRVRDVDGNEWVAKIGKEAQPETSAVRLLWAVGYQTEINYLEPIAEIVGKGTFRNVRFEARPKNLKRLDEWKWSQHPFAGSRELQGLKVLMVLINNWDVKDSNNQVLLVRGIRGNELRYIISDLGATFGQSSKTPIIWRITRSRNDPVRYAKAKFVDKVEDNRVKFHYGGKRSSLFKDITVDQARWIGNLMSQLSNQQIRDAFVAANYTPSQIDLLANEVRDRINELVRLRDNRQLGRRR